MKLLLNMYIVIFLYISCCYADANVYFSPSGGCQDAIISEISRSQKTIDIAMYYLTTREIAQELVKAKDRGVSTRIVLDQSQENMSSSKSRYLIKRGFDVKYYVGPGLMHNKFAIIDGRSLITGSFNWTARADAENEENLLIMTDKDLIKKYQDRFEYLWERSRKGELKDGEIEE